ncbi:hypothetical protein F2981_22695 (plasmid) [Sinorhizobium meliloti]|nr:hypothetical protein [Sinorhizobium meliloti]
MIGPLLALRLFPDASSMTCRARSSNEDLCCTSESYGFGTDHSALPLPFDPRLEADLRCRLRGDGCHLSR